MIALDYEIEVTGILGILTDAKKYGHIPAVKPIMDKLLQSKFRIAKDLYQSVLKKAGEA